MEDICVQNDFIEISQILINPDSVYAHMKGQEKEWETLIEHTMRCQKYFSLIYADKEIGRKIKLFGKEYLDEVGEETEALIKEMLCNVVTFHDIGKHNPNFQRNIMERKEVEKDSAYRSAGNEHSVLSAVLYMDYYDKKIRETAGKAEKKLCALMLCNAYAIARHHSGLISLKSWIDSLINGKYREISDIFQQKPVRFYAEPFTLNKSRLRMFFKLLDNMQRVQTRKQGIWLYFYEKLVYSMLVAADYYATSEFMLDTDMEAVFGANRLACFEEVYRQTKINQFIRKYESETYPMNSEQLKKNTQINTLRNEIFWMLRGNCRKRQIEIYFI